MILIVPILLHICITLTFVKTHLASKRACLQNAGHNNVWSRVSQPGFRVKL